MGFDLYGVSPVMRNINEDAYPVYNKYNGMKWEKQRKAFDKDKELADKYYEEWKKRDNENPGTYFRNNVWWWRRLWQFVCNECEDLLTEEDKQYGGSNDNHLISEEKAGAIAQRLQEKIDDGTAKEFQDYVTKYQEDAEKDKHGQPKDWDAYYPFAIGNLKEFITFCSESGGFTIG